MCLFAVDGTHSHKFNHAGNGEGMRGRDVGIAEGEARSNTRRFFEESAYPASKKFYFVGPGDGAGGADSINIFFDVLRLIEEQVNSGNCTEIVMVGWSRGAAIISELTEALQDLGNTNGRAIRHFGGPGPRRASNRLSRPLPPIKYVGLFDSVAMIMGASAPYDSKWGEDITAPVEYFAHVVAGDRTGPEPVAWLTDFIMADPLVNAGRYERLDIADATHGGVGGRDNTAHARTSYDFIRNHATLAGVP